MITLSMNTLSRSLLPSPLSLEEAALYFDVHPLFKQALEFLQTNQELFKEPGDFSIDGEALKYSVVNGLLKPESEAVLESHRKYIDIHYVISGVEKLGWKAVSECSPKDSPKNNYDESTDLIFYNEAADNWVILNEGHFVIFFPGVAHAPMLGSGAIKKIVMKVRAK